MRTRLTLLFVVIVAMAGFAALNWSEFVRPTQLSWGVSVSEAPLGLLLLAILALSWVGFLIGSAYLETHYKLTAHRNSKALETQRMLADRAEASRFTELRTYLESQAAIAVQRESTSATRIEKALHLEHRDLLAALDRLGAKMDRYPGDVARTVELRHNGQSPH